MTYLPKSHGGKKEGTGGKPASKPTHTKKFRATEDEWVKFLALLLKEIKKVKKKRRKTKGETYI